MRQRATAERARCESLGVLGSRPMANVGSGPQVRQERRRRSRRRRSDDAWHALRRSCSVAYQVSWVSPRHDGRLHPSNVLPRHRIALGCGGADQGPDERTGRANGCRRCRIPGRHDRDVAAQPRFVIPSPFRFESVLLRARRATAWRASARMCAYLLPMSLHPGGGSSQKGAGVSDHSRGKERGRLFMSMANHFWQFNSAAGSSRLEHCGGPPSEPYEGHSRKGHDYVACLCPRPSSRNRSLLNEQGSRFGMAKRIMSPRRRPERSSQRLTTRC